MAVHCTPTGEALVYCGAWVTCAVGGAASWVIVKVRVVKLVAVTTTDALKVSAASYSNHGLCSSSP